MIELIETSQEPLMNNTLGEVTPPVHPLNLLDPYLTYFGIDDLI